MGFAALYPSYDGTRGGGLTARRLLFILSVKASQ
jgi:hypothetical protein